MPAASAPVFGPESRKQEDERGMQVSPQARPNKPGPRDSKSLAFSGIWENGFPTPVDPLRPENRLSLLREEAPRLYDNAKTRSLLDTFRPIETSGNIRRKYPLEG